ncbi:hypothetical protein GE061_008307 [Apolygus lucorum]|uniref:Uncharacterized protein n=1 Tax=Apolygus lucorum TaxID=248454 RepID=A0A6A4IU31_APOLU|nr:hypothetical protein GE061_008307 [Apolygus lucorum]
MKRPLAVLLPPPSPPAPQLLHPLAVTRDLIYGSPDSKFEVPETGAVCPPLAPQVVHASSSRDIFSPIETSSSLLEA